jgi:hypothetical protein
MPESAVEHGQPIQDSVRPAPVDPTVAPFDTGGCAGEDGGRFPIPVPGLMRREAAGGLRAAISPTPAGADPRGRPIAAPLRRRAIGTPSAAIPDAPAASGRHPLGALRRSRPDGPGASTVIRRDTEPGIYPAGPGTRYSEDRNLETDLSAKLPKITLADKTSITRTDDGATLGVKVGASGAETTETVKVIVNAAGTDPYKPSSYTLAKAGADWAATVTVHHKLPGAQLIGVLTREFDEIAGRVRAAVGQGGTLDPAQARHAVFIPGATPPTAVPTPKDKATARELKTIWTAEKTVTDKMQAALTAAGMSDIQKLPPKDLKFAELKEAGFDEKTLTLLVGRPDFEKIKADNKIPKDVSFEAELVGHLIRPEYRPSTFATTGLSGGHLDSAVTSFVKAHAELEFVEVSKKDDYKKYHQYRRTDAGAAGATRPKAEDAATPAGWVQAMGTDGKPLPKTTFTDVQVFLADGLAAFRQWLDTQPDTVTTVATADFGIKNPAAVSPTSGQQFGGYFIHKAGKWTLRTLFPIL